MEKKTTTSKLNSEEKITRKEAFQKAGKYAAFTAASMMLVLSPLNSNAAGSPKKPKKH